MKSTVEQIRERFDKDVERFSNLTIGQSAVVDSPLALELIASAAFRATRHAGSVLDIGCGAGNYTLKLLEFLPQLDVTLIDLSQPMLTRAVERVRLSTSGMVTALQGDIRDLDVGTSSFDIIVAASVFHHLRTDQEWEDVFSGMYASLKPGGSIWIFDLIEHSHPEIQSLMWTRYGEYLTQMKGTAYRDEVFGYVEIEDTPRSLAFQTDLLRRVGFEQIEILHKNNCFAAFGACKGITSL